MEATKGLETLQGLTISDTSLTTAMNTTLNRIFPHLTFEIPSNIDFYNALKDKDLYDEIFGSINRDRKTSFKDFILQSTIQPLFFSEEQRKERYKKHMEEGDNGYSDGRFKAIGCEKPCTQIGGDPEDFDDTQLIGFGIAWPN